MEGGGGGEAVMGTHCTWAVVFVRGQWAGRSVVVLVLMMEVVAAIVLMLVLVVVLVVVVAVGACWWYGCHVTHGDEAPAFGVKGRRGRGM